jgi:biopolymer transport protein ExbD
MAGAIDTGEGAHGERGRRAVDADVNLIPFIDTMTVLTAFLLMTAVWTNYAQLSIKPGGLGRDAETVPTEPPINLSVLLANDGIWVGLSNGQPTKIDKVNDVYNFEALNTVLTDYKKTSGLFTDRDDIEIAAEDAVDYQSVINAMDTAVATEFKGIKYVDPQSLSVRFKQ